MIAGSTNNCPFESEIFSGEGDQFISLKIKIPFAPEEQ
jgi:hypothetical protein